MGPLELYERKILSDPEFPVQLHINDLARKTWYFAPHWHEHIELHYVLEGKNQLVVAIGCTGGKHRSVTLANKLYERIQNQNDYGVNLEHRDIGKDAARGK